MKIRINLICLCVVALLAAPGFVSPLLAQSGQPRVENRLLLVFDTSSAMKKRLPNEEKGIDQLFQLTLNGKLRPGDSVGVWTFSQDLHLGEFPQREWTEDMINTLPPEIAGFLKKKHYSKDTRFDALIPTLNEVVRTSPRLTTVIFCDGDGQLNGIPGADGINASFKQHQHDMEKARMPFVIVLRSQFDRNQIGHYVGCTISSAQDIIMPQFPPMPPPPSAPIPAPVKVVPPPPPPVIAPLIVIGTNSETKPPPSVTPPAESPQQQPAPTLPPPAIPISPVKPVPPAATPPPAIPMEQTNSAPPPAAVIQPTNTIVPPPQQATTQPAPPPAATPLPPENTGASKGRLLVAGTALFIGAIVIAYFLLRRPRGRNSLITESMKKR